MESQVHEIYAPVKIQLQALLAKHPHLKSVVVEEAVAICQLAGEDILPLPVLPEKENLVNCESISKQE